MSYFSYVGKLFSNVKGFYNEINAATLTGAIDAIIIQQEDGSFKSSPFHVRFGKLGVLRSKEKVVDIEINGEAIQDLHMKLGDTGEAFFIEEVEEDDIEELPPYLATSPLPDHGSLMETGINELKQLQQQQQEEEEGQGHKSTLTLEVNSRTHLNSVCSETTTNTKSDDASHEDIHADLERVKLEEKTKNRKKKYKKKRGREGTRMPKIPGEHGNDDIFEMEDLSTDEEMSQITAGMSTGLTMGKSTGMTKSVSLPITEESPFDRTNEWAKSHEGFKYLNNHPFSDTDLSPLGSPISTRPPTPKSDTEVERLKSAALQSQLLTQDHEESTLWDWGEMPRKSVTEETMATSERRTSPAVTDDKTPSGGLFHFMRKTKNVRHKPEEEGIYLDDLNLQDMDPEVAKLYFPKRFSQSHFHSIGGEKEEDTESGRGPSLPQSPHSVEGAIGGPSCSFLSSEVKHLGMYSMSLCGGLSDPEGLNLEKFMQKVVTFDDLCETPSMLSNPDLVLKVGDKYYNWQTAAPIILSQIAFHKSLPEKTMDSLTTQHMPKKKKKTGGVTSWFSWRRPPPDGSTTVPTSTSNSIMTSEVPLIGADATTSKSLDTGLPTLVETSSQAPIVTTSVETYHKPKPSSIRIKIEDHSSSEADTDGSDRGGPSVESSPQKKKVGRELFRRSLRLQTEQIAKLNLREGLNEVTYSVTTQYQGTKRCSCHIYLWKYNDKIIISDIDGTITKSDVLGQILPIMGRDWSQSGVAQLYSRIYDNGYKFLYLSARAIGQSRLTKELLRNIRQGEQILPEGPMLLSPTSLVSAFHREVIEKKPEEFKISCLKDIGSLFPEGPLPFYAGFGNKVNDVYAYKAINIPSFRIFTINPHGELKHELSLVFQSSYTKLTDIADHFFPPLHKLGPGSEFSQVQYWREPLPEISPIEAELVLQDKPVQKSSDS